MKDKSGKSIITNIFSPDNNSRLLPIYAPYINNGIIKFNDVKHYNDT